MMSETLPFKLRDSVPSSLSPSDPGVVQELVKLISFRFNFKSSPSSPPEFSFWLRNYERILETQKTLFKLLKRESELTDSWSHYLLMAAIHANFHEHLKPAFFEQALKNLEGRVQSRTVDTAEDYRQKELDVGCIKMVRNFVYKFFHEVNM